MFNPLSGNKDSTSQCGMAKKKCTIIIFFFFFFREDVKISQNAHDVTFYNGGYITMYSMIAILLKKKITHTYT